ncbi:MAG: WG repeat-containing protein [Daejeonella sp.]
MSTKSIIMYHTPKTLLTLTLLFLTNLSFGQKNKDYLISYVDSSSGKELIGFKSRKGEIIIKAKFSQTYTDTLYNMVIVYNDGEWIGIDRDEKLILKPFIYDNGPDYIEEGFFRFEENNKIGFADANGVKVLSANFDFATPFTNGISEYKLGGHRKYEKDGHWFWVEAYESGYLNKSGQRFKRITELKGNKREAWTKGNKHFLLNNKGKIIKTYNK